VKSPSLGKRKSIQLAFGFLDFGYSSSFSSLPFTFNIFLSLYIHSGFSLPQNHDPNGIEFDQSRFVIIHRYSSDVTDRLSFLRRRIKNLTGVILWPPLKFPRYFGRVWATNSWPRVCPLSRPESIRLSVGRTRRYLCRIRWRALATCPDTCTIEGASRQAYKLR